MTAERADFGARLRAAREARGLSLRAIATATKISALALEALERNDIGRLPGGLFSRAFVRAYAKEVGLDPEATVREFIAQFSDDPDTAEAAEAGRPHSPTQEIDGGGSPSGLRWLGLVASVALIIVWIGVDRYYNSGVETAKPAPAADAAPRAPAPPPLPTPGAAVPGAEAQAPGSTLSETSSLPMPTAPAGAQGQAGTLGQAKPVPGVVDAPVPPSAQPSPAGAPAAASSPAPASSAANLPVHVVVFARSDCWVSASADGKRVAGRTLKPGDKMDLAASQSIKLTAGDAGALSYTVNNAPGRSLGAAGQVVSIVITTANYQTFVAGRQ
jgi:cytoskeleton protein RodZ